MASCPDDTTEISRLELLQNLTDRSAICETEPQDDFKRKQHCGCGGFGGVSFKHAPHFSNRKRGICLDKFRITCITFLDPADVDRLFGWVIY
ncbi:hypothetical protein OUZ56_003965 [Daphnia magna]|uniref:Uncharacterized protein n=1 Tax=Daphnia magna TaxID=35525 RepID=A0ABQ9YNC2_9CRUS|nr:hypothetical protein OUZ56_003965 [Daphnia magna]